MRVLNRTLRWTDSGITYEPDQRHAEIIVKELNLFESSKNTTGPSKSVQRRSKPSLHSSSSRKSRGIARKGQQRVHGQTRYTSRYRPSSARLHNLSLDRPDLQFAAKQASRFMATPRVSDWAPLKRIARYLVGYPRLVQTFRWQVAASMVTSFTDSDWAGDRSRKSTSGGVVCLGHHMIKTLEFHTTTRSAIKWRGGTVRPRQGCPLDKKASFRCSRISV